eukprot:CAMPEP_0198143898 /NCGR_PEP_ID=MMETSP1443-20131203/11519_1 /TAXON_ID=186043 /ORGANISM="Entomoneis sp., Strain CCMP2396" /LENGTH=279 /DNA_ID=CAMNT_0043807203 /DNA_START=17 /DNA_END=856 /DNA_ORIENTATION=-
MSNVVVSLAVIGKNNEPLYMKEFVQRKGRRYDLVDEAELFGLTSPAQQSTTGASAPAGQEESENHEDSTSDYDDDDSVIGEINPLFNAVPVSLKQEFILHAALDRFEQLSGPPPGYAWRRTTANDTNPMYVGLLYPVEDLRVYGYMTATQIKFFCVVVDDPQHSSYVAGGSHFSSSQSVATNNSTGNITLSSPLGSARPSSPLSPRFVGAGAAAADPHLETDVILQRLFESLHQCYVSHMLNPFSPLIMTSSSLISSKRFDEYIQAAVTKHNQMCISRS